MVIDDPVSSMDTGTLFAVSALVRNMIEVCRNNAESENPVIPGNFIKQIFIFTHNVYFHREVTMRYSDRWDFTAFFLITKTNNRSSISVCDKIDSLAPTRRVNINPVKNPYAILWDQYRKAENYMELMNAMRQILEAYFIQLSGYEGNTLRHKILEDPDNRAILIQNDDGTESYSRYEIASRILSYISSGTYGVTDGIYFSSASTDLEVCRATLQRIFTLMKQEEHYNMMMKYR